MQGCAPDDHHPEKPERRCAPSAGGTFSEQPSTLNPSFPLSWE